MCSCSSPAGRSLTRELAAPAACGHDARMTAHTCDVLIIGSGAAGLTAALTLAQERTVTVLAKGPLTGGSTAWAQGGIAAVLDAGDTFEDHIRDTMVAGAGLNRRETVEFVIERAPRAIARLVEL